MCKIDFTAYIRLEQLPDEVKQKNGCKCGKTPRYDVTATTGYHKPLEALKNGKGMVYLYLNDTRGIIDSPERRRADRFLMGKRKGDSVNVSSVYLLQTAAEGGSLFGFGNPNGKPKLSNGNPNPFFECRSDGYLFIISPDWRLIEWLIIPDGLCTIQGNAKALADGIYNRELETVRERAKTFFDYWQ